MNSNTTNVQPSCDSLDKVKAKAQTLLHAYIIYGLKRTCTDLESFVRGGPTLITFFWGGGLMGGGMILFIFKILSFENNFHNIFQSIQNLT